MPKLSSLSPTALSRLLALAGKLGEVRGLKAQQPDAAFREWVHMENVRGAMALDDCPLEREQVEAILKREPVYVAAEVRAGCAFLADAFVRAESLYPYRYESLDGLAPGLRKEQFVVRRGERFSYVVPPAGQVEGLLKFFFGGLEGENAVLSSCRWVYEMLLLAPFARWNASMVCLWQSVFLCACDPVFSVLPVAALMHEREPELDNALEAGYLAGDAMPFVEWMLGVLADAVDVLLEHHHGAPKAPKRLELFRAGWRGGMFGRRDYVAFFKSISVPTASRDLAQGADAGLLRVYGNGRGTRYGFARRG
ncbi:hypothetical protein ICN84_04415 [Akkermansia glycaniphila]|uniref:hypothetical protein n=1 Tax=Akkermansia glycaniphila TaxID=1679444 RepID=UPI001C038975|nr:hypothetical protein [Akkermansia glycaniphila]MBT9449318.1 hypothetical protein [Akkermansia glycaniphila]